MQGFLIVTRYAPNGIIECSGIYKGSVNGMERMEKSVIIDHPSNCMEVNLKYKGQKLKFQRVNDFNNTDFKKTLYSNQLSPKLSDSAHSI